MYALRHGRVSLNFALRLSRLPVDQLHFDRLPTTKTVDVGFEADRNLAVGGTDFVGPFSTTKRDRPHAGSVMPHAQIEMTLPLTHLLRLAMDVALRGRKDRPRIAGSERAEVFQFRHGPMCEIRKSHFCIDVGIINGCLFLLVVL